MQAQISCSVILFRKAENSRRHFAGGYCFILGSGFGLLGIFITLVLDEFLRSIANLYRFLRRTA